MKFRKLVRIFERDEMKLGSDFGNHSIGENVDIHNSTIGNYSYISRNSNIHNCEIGKFCSIGPNVTIGFGNHPTNFLSTSPVFYENSKRFDLFSEELIYDGKACVIIENDVWIGANVFIKNGITIRNGAIIGAGAVVLNDVPEYAIAVGVPAKVIKLRFEQHRIQQLLEMKWWDWPAQSIKEFLPLMSQANLMDSDEKFNQFLHKVNGLYK